MVVTVQEINSLGDEQFEKLAKTLLLSVIGLGVTPFYKGKDGAREAKYSGKAPYPGKENGWEGEWVFQVKYSDINLGINKARNQVKYLIDGELSKLKNYGFLPKGCDNYIYITNVPFSGEANIGMHDYIELKKKEYGVKHFDYWDGEKIATLINSFTSVKQSFFTIPGISYIDEIEWERLKAVFVKPRQYKELKMILCKDKFLNIVGQPHVGKSSLAAFLAKEILSELALNNVINIPLIDALQSVPQILNSVVIFDDLYGDLNYEGIGRRSKVINSLHKENYIIITSRDYIFNDATEDGEVYGAAKSSPQLLQEGSYSDADLEQILINHALLRLKAGELKSKTFAFVQKHKGSIIYNVRFPHNLQFFVESLPEQVLDKKSLDDLIQQSKRIEFVIHQWIVRQTEPIRNVLLLLSLGKLNSKKAVMRICQKEWGYTTEEVQFALAESKRVLKDGMVIKFHHPSFKSAILNAFLERWRAGVTNLLINLISNQQWGASGKLSRAVLADTLNDLSTEALIDLIKIKTIKKPERVQLWYHFLRRNSSLAVDTFLELLDQQGGNADQQLTALAATKDNLTAHEVQDLLFVLFKKRNISPRLIDNLIVIFCFRIREKVPHFFDFLDEGSERDLHLKIRMLGAIGSKYPDRVFHQLMEYGEHPKLTNKRVLYGSLHNLNASFKKQVIFAFENFLKQEGSPSNRIKLEKSLANLKRAADLGPFLS